MIYFTQSIDKYLANWVLKDTCLTPQDIEDNFYPLQLNVIVGESKIEDVASMTQALQNFQKDNSNDT